MKEDPLPPMELFEVESSGVTVHPRGIIDTEARRWQDLWAPHPVGKDRMQRAFETARAAAELEPMEPIAEWDVRRPARAMRANTGLGADRMAPIDVESLPSEALVELAELLNTVEQTLAWPHQTQLIIGKLLPKK
eukprot:6885255-Pyramimonas_sp.AAC.1